MLPSRQNKIVPTIIIVNGIHYKIQKGLGEGVQGSVVLANELDGGGNEVIGGKKLAVKIFCDEDGASDARAIAGAQHEVAGFKKFYANNPDLLAQVDINADEASPCLPYVTMPYFEGDNLAALLIGSECRLAPLQLLNVFSQWLHILQDLQAMGMIYVDMKPENFILTEDGVLRLIDFGAAYDVSKQQRQQKSAFLTPDVPLGTFQYYPLSILDADKKYIRTFASDREATVVSFAMLLMNIVTRWAAITYGLECTLVTEWQEVIRAINTGISIVQFRDRLVAMLEDYNCANYLSRALFDGFEGNSPDVGVDSISTSVQALTQDLAVCLRQGLSDDESKHDANARWIDAESVITELPNKLDSTVICVAESHLRILQNYVRECKESLEIERGRLTDERNTDPIAVRKSEFLRAMITELENVEKEIMEQLAHPVAEMKPAADRAERRSVDLFNYTVQVYSRVEAIAQAGERDAGILGLHRGWTIFRLLKDFCGRAINFIFGTDKCLAVSKRRFIETNTALEGNLKQQKEILCKQEVNLRKIMGSNPPPDWAHPRTDDETVSPSASSQGHVSI